VAATEPTPSGRHDLERVAHLCRHFQIPLAVIINKYDLNQDETNRIEAFCQDEGYPVVAHLPHDPVVIAAMVQGKVVTEMPSTNFSHELGQAWAKIEGLAGPGQ
jgi:MinD superfamily P-loop ATPase